MARIFYHTNTGNIYGVHPDGNIRVPVTVSFIDVVEAPDKILWPVLPDGRSGKEQSSRVNLGTKVLEIRPDGVPPLDPDDELLAALSSLKGTSGTTDDLIDVLLGTTGREGRIAAKRL